MSFTELKDSVVELTVEERLELAALITHLNQAEDPEYQQELDARMMAMEGGKKFTAGDLTRVHAELSAKG